MGGLAARKAKLVQLYDTPLMLGGGRAAGWAVTAGEDIEALEQAIEGLAQPEAFREKYPGAGTAPFALAVGDGNHSLAAAKAYWEELKPALSGREQQVHPARFCLAEVCSVSGPAMHIEPIHRAVFGIEPGRFLCAFEAFLREKGALAPQGGARQLRILGKGGETAGVLCVNSAVHPLAVGTLEAFPRRPVRAKRRAGGLYPRRGCRARAGGARGGRGRAAAARFEKEGSSARRGRGRRAAEKDVFHGQRRRKTLLYGVPAHFAVRGSALYLVYTML